LSSGVAGKVRILFPATDGGTTLLDASGYAMARGVYVGRSGTSRKWALLDGDFALILT